MGGYEGGQEASRIAVEVIEEVYATEAAGRPALLASAGFSGRAPSHPGICRQVSRSAWHGDYLYRDRPTRPSAVLRPRRRQSFYLIRGSSISRLTRDHSYVSRLVQNGVLRAEEAESHPQRHILTAALGAGNNVIPDSPIQPVALESGDVLVLCTDGLWGLLSESDIQVAVAGKPPPKFATRWLRPQRIAAALITLPCRSYA